MSRFRFKKISRRNFCKMCLLSGASLAFSPLLIDVLKESAQAAQKKGGLGFLGLQEAMFYKKLDKKTIQCQLCPNFCTLKNEMRGFCRVRETRDGKLYSLVYANPTAIHIDPIEKKPLFHFLPATTAFSIATAGCNFRCKFCQNWEISQFKPEETVNHYLPPDQVVEKAIKYGCSTIAYTYTEPSIFYEYMLDTAKSAKVRGLKNIYHSNGSLNPEPAQKLAVYLDGANIDLKGFSQDFYSKVSQGHLETVLDTLKILKKNKVHLEITNLIVPPLNDDMAMIKKMCIWIRDELGKDVPLHFSRFHPTYKLKNLTPTPTKTLEEARNVALAQGLEYVYIGNIPGHEAENTYCPNDNKVVIKRTGYRVLENNVINGKCKFCGTGISGVWKKASFGDKQSKPSSENVSKYFG